MTEVKLEWVQKSRLADGENSGVGGRLSQTFLGKNKGKFQHLQR